MPIQSPLPHEVGYPPAFIGKRVAHLEPLPHPLELGVTQAFCAYPNKLIAEGARRENRDMG
jgi:hypothetical protein